MKHYILQYRFLFIWFDFKKFLCRAYTRQWETYIEYDKSKLYNTFLNYNIPLHIRFENNSLGNTIREILLDTKNKIIIENDI